MKTKVLTFATVVFCCFLATCASVFAQGTAFTYQGQLTGSNGAAHGTYDLTFKLWNASSGGSQVGSTITASSTAITNGLFTVILDFGSQFNGTSYWLELGVRTNGAVSFTTLIPRQELTPTPYAITAENVDGPVPASQLTGTLPSVVLSGSYGSPINLVNPADTFFGNGSGLTSLNASQLTSGTVPDARLSTNVAFLHNNQTFTGTNVFASGGGAGRLIVSNGFTAVDTSLFTGLSFQYDGNFGEGALMSSFNDGTAYLSFYTKPFSGRPITKQVIIDAYGVLGIDQGNNNNGFLNNGNTNGAGLAFGAGATGEGIASKRTPGGNQNGLDFYTSFSNRMSILNNGYVGIGRQSPITGADIFDVRSPATAGSYGGMYLDTVGTNTLPFYGYAMNGVDYAWTYLDGSDGNKWKLYNGGNWLTVTPSGLVGINTTTPSGQLDVEAPNSYNGIYVSQGALDGNGIYVQATNGTSAYGVEGYSPAGYGVVAGSSTGTGVYAYSGSGPALTIGSGAIHVSGAGINTSTAAFIHVATAANISANYTIIHNSLCDGDPNAILLVTPNLSPQGALAVYNNHPIGVWYNGSNWTIFEQDVAGVPVNAAFNVLIIKN